MSRENVIRTIEYPHDRRVCDTIRISVGGVDSGREATQISLEIGGKIAVIDAKIWYQLGRVIRDGLGIKKNASRA